ncbi:MAG: hypothetical protein QOG00_1612 [Pyrinomonadaceae bacterium]|jgi:hypothetical protein|nr:hypothetical protein [Pyrinomonadaceae bacterium]MDQ1611681.1 hypothetical protein [Pyrinomonadaceae bacterium]
MTRKIFALSLLVLMAGVLAFAQEAKQPLKLTGYLIDNMCAGAEGEGDGVEETAKGHPTACALMPACSATGYSLVVEKKIYKLDEAGNKAALAVLKATKAKKGLRVEVEGTLDGNNLRATKVSEVNAAG